MRTRHLIGVRFLKLVANRPRTLIGALLPRMSTGREIRLIEEAEGDWSAINEELNVASQGETREGSLEILDEAVALHQGEIGDPITDENLRELGIGSDSASDKPPIPDAPVVRF